MSDDASTIIGQQSALETARSNFESWWQDIAYRVLPRDAQFTTESSPGEKRTERLFDSTAADSLERFSAVMDDLNTPRTQIWNHLKSKHPDLRDDDEVKEHLEEVNRILYALRYRPKANFASQKHLGYMSVGAFGNSALFIDEEVGVGPRYQNVHMREVYWATNHFGVVDMLHRKYKLEARQALQRFGNKLPQKIRDSAEKKPFEKFTFLHCTKPNEERVAGRLDYRGMPWSSYFVCCDTDRPEILEAGGYTSWPWAIGRYVLAPGEVYARSPAMTCWPAILTLQEQKKTILRAGQKEVDPPVLLTEDGALEPFNLRPGALNHGLVSDQGSALAVPFKSGANIPLGVELMALEKESVENSFLVTVFKVLLENPQMTATQVLEIAQQKAMLLAPIMGRQQSEDLGPMIEREIDICAKNGLLPPMPDALLERNGEYEIEYTSPLARAMRAQDGVAIIRTLEVAPAAIALDKNSALVIDVPNALREVAEINGVPEKLLRDKKTVERMAQEQAEADQAAQLAAVAPDMSQAALNAAKAEQLRSVGATS